MRNLELLTFFFGTVFSLPTYVLAQAFEPTPVDSPIEKIFVPNGFDDNDNVDVVLHGEFPNDCFRVGNVTAEVMEAERIIKVTATSLQYQGTACAEMLVPFVQQIKVGVLKAGPYRVVVNDKLEAAAPFFVKPRITEAADDHFYAPVEFAELVTTKRGPQFVQLTGRYPIPVKGCIMIDEIRVRREGDVIVVLPIMHPYDGEACADHKLEFKKDVALDFVFKGEGLLHVRAVNGNSYNRFINVN